MAQDQDLEMTCITRRGHELLYKDFAKVRHFDPASFSDTYRWATRPEPPCDFPVRNLARSPAKYIEFGTASEEKKYDFLVHARARRFCRPSDNWSLSNWGELVRELGGKVASVGTLTQAEAIEGTEDLRGIPLSALADIMRSSGMILGSSSGTMHFATLCQCPQIVWSGIPHSPIRYENIWNPFDVKVSFIRENHPHPDKVLNRCLNF